MVQSARRACVATLLALGALAVNTPPVAAATNPAKADYEAAALTLDEVNTTLAPIQVADNGSGALKAGAGLAPICESSAPANFTPPAGTGGWLAGYSADQGVVTEYVQGWKQPAQLDRAWKVQAAQVKGCTTWEDPRGPYTFNVMKHEASKTAMTVTAVDALDGLALVDVHRRLGTNYAISFDLIFSVDPGTGADRLIAAGENQAAKVLRVKVR